MLTRIDENKLTGWAEAISATTQLRFEGIEFRHETNVYDAFYRFSASGYVDDAGQCPGKSDEQSALGIRVRRFRSTEGDGFASGRDPAARN